MGHVRGTAGRSADGKEGKERADMATGVWDLLALFPTAKKRNMGTMGCEQTPSLWKALQDRVFSQGTLLIPGAG